MYVGLCVAVAVAVRWQWQRALGPNPRAESVELDVYRLAMLNGGPQLTITAAAARLHRSGLLREGDEPRTLVVDGPLDADATDIERAVFDAVQRQPHIRSAELRRELADSEPVAQLASRLGDVGLLLKPETIARMRRLWLLAVPLLVLGAARLWAGVEADAQVGYLAIGVVAVAFATVWLAGRRPWTTARGQAVVARKRADHRQLSTGGTSSQMPLAVALYGGAALWAAEPAIASAWS
ncbi:MAG: TIGR04222 domain-containing membrane protein, partial [Solirubrobacteraceae bacterium]